MITRKRFFSVIFILFLACFLVSPFVIWAQPRTHIVVKGDTLWDICEKYYGDPNLWPKLWQMNPFITNPHLLKPGDLVTLLEGVPLKKPVEEEKIPVKEVPKPKPIVPKVAGIDVSGFTNVHTLGYLSAKEMEPWGTVLASESGRTLLSPGETIFVNFDRGKVIKPGDQFNICQSSPLIMHPITGEEIGYIFSVRARLVIQEPVGLGYAYGEFYRKKNVYKAKILEVYKELKVGDPVLPHEPVSHCVQPVSMEEPLIGNIVANQDQLTLIATHMVVYLDHGFNDGVRRGNIFEVVRTHIIPDPDRKHESPTSPPKIILPDIPVGTIMVLESRPDTATAIVLSSNEEFSNGTYIKGLSWIEAPELLARIPMCPTE